MARSQVISNLKKMSSKKNKSSRQKIKLRLPLSFLVTFSSPIFQIPSEHKWSNKWLCTLALKISTFLNKQIQAHCFLSSKKVKLQFKLMENTSRIWKKDNLLANYLCFILLHALLLSKLSMTAPFGDFTKAYSDATLRI